MADVYDYVIPQGVIVPDTTVIQQQVNQEYFNAFGADLIVSPNTPQGLLITEEILSRSASASNNVQVANQINPNLAGGIFLDAIGALTGSTRNPQGFSLVIGTIGGVVGTIIPEGKQAQEITTNQIYETLTTVTIPLGGSINTIFRAINPGPLIVIINTLTVIISDVPGWETINNSAANYLTGTNLESDNSFRARRKSALANQGTSTAIAIISGLEETEGVESVGFRENNRATTQVIDGVTMVSHSIYACVDGGADLDVATTLMTKKDVGCAYNNGPGINISETITVPISGQSMIILFDRPQTIGILVKATVKVADSIDNPVLATQQAINDYAEGNIPGLRGLVVGQSVSCFELSGAVMIENPGIYVQNMQTSLISPVNYTNAEIPIDVWQKANIAGITVVVVS